MLLGIAGGVFGAAGLLVPVAALGTKMILDAVVAGDLAALELCVHLFPRRACHGQITLCGCQLTEQENQGGVKAEQKNG